ncbi:MAG: hypothetical protein JEZ04_06040 [Spirochaetales bacterium]|nr:hypothetical protein [Spirochaetales bacterium]
MIIVNINPGICGLNTIIKAESTDSMVSKICIKSSCPAVTAFSEKIPRVEVMKDIFAPFGSSAVFREAALTITHAACPVPTAVLKAAEASASLALPADVTMEMKKE